MSRVDWREPYPLATFPCVPPRLGTPAQQARPARGARGSGPRRPASAVQGTPQRALGVLLVFAFDVVSALATVAFGVGLFVYLLKLIVERDKLIQQQRKRQGKLGSDHSRT